MCHAAGTRGGCARRSAIRIVGVHFSVQRRYAEDVVGGAAEGQTRLVQRLGVHRVSRKRRVAANGLWQPALIDEEHRLGGACGHFGHGRYVLEQIGALPRGAGASG